MKVKHNEDVPARLAGLYLDMKADPDNKDKRLAYFEALADARLSDYYKIYDEWRGMGQRIEALRKLSDVGDLFDGHDELNEYTHEANEKHLIAAMDKIHAIADGAAYEWIGGCIVLDEVTE